MFKDQKDYTSQTLDFDQARTKHLLFKTNLRSILYGELLNHAPILSQYECGVGKWIYGHALEQYGHIPEMNELEKVHANIHRCARDLIVQYEAGAVENARAGLSEMESIADKLIALLDIVEIKISNEKTVDIHSSSEEKGLDKNYQELLLLQQTILQLDDKIKVQTGISNAARNLAENNEHKFRNTVMQAPVGIVILRGEEMLVEMANHAYLTIVDKQKDLFIGRSLYDSLPETKETVFPVLSAVLKTGKPFHGNEFEIILNRFGKKETTFFNLVYSPLREEDNRISGVIVVATEVTTQVKTKMALEQKDAQFRKLVSQSPIAMAIIRGDDLIIELANNALLKNIWRKEWTEVEGKKLLDIFPELVHQQFPQWMRQVLNTGIVHTEKEAIAIVNSRDGSKEYFLDFEYSPLHEIDGTVSGIMVTVNDVTEKVLDRKKVELAQKKYRDLIETLPVAVFTIDVDGYLDLYNQAAVNLWGRTPVKAVDKWCGSHGLFTLDKTLVPHEICPMATALKENRAITTEAYVERPDGELRHVIAHPQPMHNDVGEVIGALNVLIDITDRKETEIALVTSEEKFRVLANSMPQFIWTANAEGELNYFSQSVFDFSGFSAEKIYKDGWLEIVHPADREDNIALWTAAITTGNDFIYEHRFRREDGEYRWQLSRAVPQKDLKGNIQMWVGTSTDIHDRRLFLEELTEKVAERTRELTITNENLLKSNAELAQFAYVASHDLQEPLRKIQAFISRILENDHEVLSAKSKDYFERIRKSSNRTQLLIQDLLSFSRVNAVEKELLPTNLNEIAAKIKEDILSSSDQRKISIRIGDLPTINAVDFQVEQLLTNLFTNAIKFAKVDFPCEIEITSVTQKGIDIEHLPVAVADKNYHVISFKDNGIGFDSQFSERIFLVFQRLHSKEAYEGTGIGLAICKKIVENHHGFIMASGVPGMGTTFTIILPAMETGNTD